MLLKCDQLVSTSISADFKHYAITSVWSQIGEDWMFREVKVLETDYFTIIWGNLNREDQILEEGDERFNMRISVSQGFFLEFFSEISGLESLFIFLDVDDFRVLHCVFFSLNCVVIDFLEDSQDINDIANFFSELWSCSPLLADKSDDFSVSKPLEDCSDKFILGVVLPKLK